MSLDNIKNISIKSFLAGRGIAPKQERGGYGMYLSPFCDERTPSFKVDYGQNLWFDFGSGEGGSIIDLVARMDGCSVGEAIRRLEGEALGGGVSGTGAASFSSHQDTLTPERPRVEIVSVENLKHPALVEYLTERSIEPAAARKYCSEVRYRIGDRDYFAIGFRNDAGGWELRNRSFKGSSTPKNITTIRGGGWRGTTTGADADGIGTTPASTNGSDTVMVFEGFIDFLSYLSLKGADPPTIDTTVLNSVANLRRSIPFLESHRTIHAFLDNRRSQREQRLLAGYAERQGGHVRFLHVNDAAGRKTLADLRVLLPAADIIDQSPFYRSHKDLNDYWKEQAADKIRRSMSIIPVKKKGRGL